MRKNLFLSICLTFWFLACNKDTFDDFGFYGNASVNIKGIEWASKVGIFKDKNLCDSDTCIGIILENDDESGNQNHQIIMGFLPLRKGKIVFNYTNPSWKKIKQKFTYYSLNGGDVVTGSYHISEQDESNYVEITKLNLKTGDIEGNFKALVEKDSIFTPKGEISDTLRISNGVFKGRINWRE